MGKRIIVIGSSNTDMIIKLPKIPVPGETCIGGIFCTAAGGKGANQAVAAARAGGEVVFVACVGDDIFGKEAVGGFKRDNIDTDFIKISTGIPSGVALIFVDEKGENSIAVASGANANLTPDDIKEAANAFSGADILLMQLETPLETVKAAAEKAVKSGIPVILNPAPAKPLGDDILKNISIITPNETEAEILTGIKVTDELSASKAADILIGKGIPTVLITMGSKGVFAVTKGFREMIPSFKVDAVDTTAAGDVFNGVLAVMLAGNMQLGDAVRIANAAAAISVTRMGAQPSAPYRKEIEEFMHEKGWAIF